MIFLPVSEFYASFHYLNLLNGLNKCLVLISSLPFRNKERKSRFLAAFSIVIIPDL